VLFRSLRATDGLGAIEELLTRLVQAGAVPQDARPSISASLIQREQFMSTGIGAGFALPHAASQLISSTVFAFGRSRSGIDFASIDDRPVEFILLYIVSTSGERKWLRSLVRGYKSLCVDEDVRKSLRSCSTAEEMAKILKKAFDGDQPQT